jgi:hypothetical protein
MGRPSLCVSDAGAYETVKILLRALTLLAVLLAAGLAEADPFDWSQSSTTTTGRLGDVAGHPLRFRAGSTPQGEHHAVAVELLWGARRQTLVDEMADAHPSVRRQGRAVVVVLTYEPTGLDALVKEERHYVFDRARGLFVRS